MTSLNLTDYPSLVLAISDPLTVKVLATTSESGEPHLAVKSFLRLSQTGGLTFDEIIETSRTNANLVRALWFNQKVAVNLCAPDGKAYLLRGLLDKVLISGRQFQERYELVRRANPKSGLAAVWFIEILEVEETTLERRRVQEEVHHPLLIHLDRLMTSDT
jgi:hypothetical protein